MYDEICEKIVWLRFSQALINEEYKAGKFKIPVHLALGHEAIAVAVNSVVSGDDRLVLTHRNAAYNLVRLGRLRPIMDEYLLKPGGLSGGKLGSMNLIQPERNVVYTSSILGNGYSVAVGIAMSEKIKDADFVTFVFGGDGSIEEGSFYESLVMAKTLGVKVLFIVENNEWSLGTHVNERRCAIGLDKFTDSIGVEYKKLRGNNVFQYIEALKDIKNDLQKKSCPICVEFEVKTLGGRWVDQMLDKPQGRYINYHAGPAPTVEIKRLCESGGVIYEDESDPVFVLSQEIGRDKLDEFANAVIRRLENEI